MPNPADPTLTVGQESTWDSEQQERLKLVSRLIEFLSEEDIESILDCFRSTSYNLGISDEALKVEFTHQKFPRFLLRTENKDILAKVRDSLPTGVFLAYELVETSLNDLSKLKDMISRQQAAHRHLKKYRREICAVFAKRPERLKDLKMRLRTLNIMIMNRPFIEGRPCFLTNATHEVYIVILCRCTWDRCMVEAIEEEYPEISKYLPPKGLTTEVNHELDETDSEAMHSLARGEISFPKSENTRLIIQQNLNLFINLLGNNDTFLDFFLAEGGSNLFVDRKAREQGKRDKAKLLLAFITSEADPETLERFTTCLAGTVAEDCSDVATREKNNKIRIALARNGYTIAKSLKLTPDFLAELRAEGAFPDFLYSEMEGDLLSKPTFEHVSSFVHKWGYCSFDNQIKILSLIAKHQPAFWLKLSPSLQSALPNEIWKEIEKAIPAGLESTALDCAGDTSGPSGAFSQLVTGLESQLGMPEPTRRDMRAPPAFFLQGSAEESDLSKGPLDEVGLDAATNHDQDSSSLDEEPALKMRKV